MHIARSDKPIKLYSRDTIISVGYRVNSKQATQFRIWATRVIKEHLIQGYTLNEKRLLEAKNKLKEIQQTILFIKEKSTKSLLQGKTDELLELIADYSRTFTLLEQYDSGKLQEVKGSEGVKPFSYEEAKSAIDQLRDSLSSQSETSGDLFGNERGKGLDVVLGRKNS